MLLEAAQTRTTCNSVEQDKHGTTLSAPLNVNGTSLTCSRHETELIAERFSWNLSLMLPFQVPIPPQLKDCLDFDFGF